MYEARNDQIDFMACSRAAQLEAENTDLKRLLAKEADVASEIERLQSLIASYEAAARLMTPRQSPVMEPPRSRPRIHEPSRTAPPPVPNFSAAAAAPVAADAGLCTCPPDGRAHYRSLPPRCVLCGKRVVASPTIDDLAKFLEGLVDGAE